MTPADLLAKIPRRNLQTRDGIICSAERFAEALRQLRLSVGAEERAIRDAEHNIKVRCLAAGYTENEAKDCARVFKVHTLRWLMNTPLGS
jgi:hypothetical protein